MSLKQTYYLSPIVEREGRGLEPHDDEEGVTYRYPAIADLPSQGWAMSEDEGPDGEALVVVLATSEQHAAIRSLEGVRVVRESDDVDLDAVGVGG